MVETDLHEIFPIAPETPVRARENRLVLRVLEIWRQACADELLPQAGSFSVADFGEDADHVFAIDLLHAKGPCFSEIGAAVRVSGWPWEEEPVVADCPDDSVLGLASHHWREIVDRGVPVTRGGTGVNEGGTVLYRGVMMPTVDAGGKIVAILGAVNWRTVDETHEAHRQ